MRTGSVVRPTSVSTAANAADGDGSGTPLSRDAVTDSNGASDIFLAAICAQDVDTRAFSQSLAGKFRHPRCATCHSMQRADTLAFVSSAVSTQTGGPQPHAGPPPGTGFPSNDPATCEQCHLNSTAFPVEAWQAPAASFDLRSKTVAELAVAAQNVPSDETEHFVTDPRVLWALDSGILPTVGGRNGVADDDHDGIDEPSDRDGIARPVPGGSAVFIQQIEEWNESGNLVTAAAAVTDITLVSRAASSTNAGDGASSRPQILYVPNGGFTAPGTVGTIYIVYQSDASDLVAGDTNGATDIFRTAIDLVADAAGNLDLVINGNATAVSATNGTTNVGDGASTMAVVGGASANVFAYLVNFLLRPAPKVLEDVARFRERYFAVKKTRALFEGWVASTGDVIHKGVTTAMYTMAGTAAPGSRRSSAHASTAPAKSKSSNARSKPSQPKGASTASRGGSARASSRTMRLLMWRR